jgi:hypothetical protein
MAPRSGLPLKQGRRSKSESLFRKVVCSYVASEILSIPEEHLADFCKLLDIGMIAASGEVSDALLEGLGEWNEEMKNYLEERGRDDDEQDDEEDHSEEEE